MERVVLALDLGTTGNRVIAFNHKGRVVARSYYSFRQIYPHPGWVEHDPLEMWDTTRKALQDVLARVGVENVVGLGVANQRETTILWEKDTGRPIYNAIVWQCRRTVPLCHELGSWSDGVKKRTGLRLDPYFSATKVRWILDNVDGVRDRVERGEILFGTVDTWILWNLTGGEVHATEPGNASRTLLFNTETLEFDPWLLDLFKVPPQLLPQVKPSIGEWSFTHPSVTGKPLPIGAVLGDQPASLFAQGGWEKGVAKNTYGTGLFLMMEMGKRRLLPLRLLGTVAWWLGEGEVSYALEGSVFIGGAAIQWLRDGLKIFSSAADTEFMARELESNEGVYFVPALAGLGAPHWDPDARGLIIGLTRSTTREHLARAALEALAYQTRDVVEEFRDELGEEVSLLRVDGGAAANTFLMQFQADILGIKVERPRVLENTGLGAAFAAGLALGFWQDRGELRRVREVDKVFSPSMEVAVREKYYKNWQRALERAKGWEVE